MYRLYQRLLLAHRF
ncbi:hypothetical protein D039_4182A, partial [Vibrio parahaemolyticus EKP-028]